MKRNIGVGVIGTGFARRTQIPGFAAVDGARVVSVSSKSLSNARSTAAEFGIPHFTNNWKETVEHEDVDIVCVTTPPNLHLDMTLHAFSRGKHVLCEKPMAMNVTEASEMTRLAGRSNLMAIIDHELRFTNGRIKAFEMIREGKIGSVRHAKYNFRNSVRGDANLPWTWWSDEKQGGGALGAIGSHVIDTFRWFTDAEITDVYCTLQTHIKQRPGADGGMRVTSDDQTMMVLKFGDGEFVEDATAMVSASMVEAGPYRNRVELFGSEGALRIEDGGEIFFSDSKDSTWETIDLEVGKSAPGMQEGGWSKGFTVLAKKIIRALQVGATTVEHAATFKDGLEVQKVLDAARKSAENGITVKI